MGKAGSGHHSDGLTLVEVAVAMLILVILAVATLPFYANSLRLSSSNITLSTATQLVSKELDTLRAVPPTCRGIQGQAAGPSGLLWTDPRGTVLQIHKVTSAACPGIYPALIEYSVNITEQGKTKILSAASTKVYVESTCGVTVSGDPIAPSSCPAAP